MPTPGSPTIVTSCTDRCCAARSKVPIRSGFSSSRPTNGVLYSRMLSRPKRSRTAFARQSESGSAFPFTETGWSGSYSKTWLVARYVCSPTATPFTGAALWMRAAVLTTSPVTIPSPCSGRAPTATTASPVLIPTRTCRSRSGSASFSSAIASRMLEPRPHGPLGVVLVRHGSAEGGHDRVTDELLDRAAVALDLLPQAGVVGTDAGAHVLRVLLLGGGGEADQVAEEDGDDLPLLERACAAARQAAPRRTDKGPPGSSLAQAGQIISRV